MQEWSAKVTLLQKEGSKLRNLLHDQNGSVLTEYGILVVIIAVGLIAILGTFRESIITKFNEIISGISGAS